MVRFPFYFHPMCAISYSIVIQPVLFFMPPWNHGKRRDENKRGEDCLRSFFKGSCRDCVMCIKQKQTTTGVGINGQLDLLKEMGKATCLERKRPSIHCPCPSFHFFLRRLLPAHPPETTPSPPLSLTISSPSRLRLVSVSHLTPETSHITHHTSGPCGIRAPYDPC